MKNDTLILIPVYNEEENITKVIDEINATKIPADILVVNDGSLDNTEEIIRQKKINFLSLPFNFGYGNALQLGFKYAMQNNYNYIIQFDGDGQHNASDLLTILDTLRNKHIDIVIGSRFHKDSQFKLSLLKKAAIIFLRTLIFIFSGYKINDPTSGLQGLSRKTFTYFAKPWNFPSDYPDADVLIKMLKLGYSAVEVPAHMRIRENGKSMHSGLKPIFYIIKITMSIIIVVFNHYLTRRKIN